MSAMISYIRKRDEKAFFLVNQRFHNGGITSIMKLITHMGSMPFILIIILFFTLFPLTRESNLQKDLAIHLLLSHSIVQLIKVTVHRQRPFCHLEKVFSTSIPKCQYSFPSGHTNAAFVTAFILSQYFPLIKGLFLVLAFFVGVSRIYLGVHYPTDTIVGGLIAYIVTAVSFSWIPWL